MFKQLLLAFLLLVTTLLAEDARLKHYANATEWEKDADTNADSAYNLGYTYQTKIKDYENALYWYKKAYSLDKGTDVANNLASLYVELKNYNEAIKWYQEAVKKGHAKSAYNLAYVYDEKLKDYPNAIKYYEKAYEMGFMGGAHSLAILYRDTLKQPNEAIKWYKKGAQKGDVSSTKGAGFFYYNKGDKVTAGAYFLALINIKYPKEKVLNFLKTKWSLTDEEIEKAYQLQLQLDIPKHYTGGVN